MNPTALCPDDRLARARRGQASGDDRERIDEHLRACGVCRVAFSFAVELDDDAVAVPGDDLLIRRLAERTAAGARGAAPRPRRHDQPARVQRGWLDRATWRRRALPAAAAFLAFAALAAAAVAWLSSPARPGSARPGHDVNQVRRVNPSGVSATPRIEPAAPASPRQRADSPPSPPARVESAALWLRRARRARAQGDRARAVTLYWALQERFPQSDEALVSHVSLGTLLLEMPDAARRARSEFDAYLSITARGAAGAATLREEALAGRARALAALGDRDGEARSWRDLMEAFPHSLHAPVARERLGVLAP